MKEDIKLIQDTLDGNKCAERLLYDNYKDYVRNFLRMKYSEYYEIDDDVSDIMIKVFTKLNSFDSSKSKFKSWVTSIAKNHMIDKWRNSHNPVFENINVTYTTSTSEFNYYNSQCEYDFENNNSLSYISTQLTPQDYTLLNMKYLQGYDYNEIGNEFNVTSSTISNRVNYIKTKLKKNNTEIIYE